MGIGVEAPPLEGGLEVTLDLDLFGERIDFEGFDTIVAFIGTRGVAHPARTGKVWRVSVYVGLRAQISLVAVKLTHRAYSLAQDLLAEPLPRRWEHSKGVARCASSLHPILGADADLLHAAAILHDIGYSPTLATTGFHQLDGGRYLRHVVRADERIVRLVAHHSCALLEAEERGLAEVLADEFDLDQPDLVDALVYCDMTTTPDGFPTNPRDRIAEILARYGPSSVVERFIRRAASDIFAATERVERRIASM